MTHNTISSAALAEGQLIGALFHIRDEYVIAHELLFAGPVSRVLRFGFRKRPPVSSLAASLDDQLRALDTLLPRLTSLTLSPARLKETEEYFQGLRKAIAALRTWLGVALRRGHLSQRSSIETQMYLSAAAEFKRQSDRAREPRVPNSDRGPVASLAPVIASPASVLPKIAPTALEAALPNVAQAAFIENVRTQILAFDERFGRHRKGMADATADLFNALERLSSQAGDLKLDEIPQRHLAILAGERDRYLPKADLYNPGVEFEGFQHPLSAKTARRISIISARAAGTPLSALQAEFYERAIATLTRLKEVFSRSHLHGDSVIVRPKERTAEEFGQIRRAVGNLSFEAQALEIEGAVLHGLQRLRSPSEGVSDRELSRLLVLLGRTARRPSNTADSTEA